MTTAAKKYWLIGTLCISLPLALLMGGCSIGGPDEETLHVIELISKIDDVSLQTAATIETASDAFDQLDENQKNKVENRDKLKAAEKKLDELMARSVDDEIKAIGEVSLDKEKAISDAREAYDALSLSQKKLVDTSDLEHAEEQLAQIKKQFSVGQTVKTDKWNITLTSATVTDTLESSESRTYWEVEPGYAFMILEFDVTALTSDKLPVDEYAITDLVADYNGDDYSNWTIRYIANELWLYIRNTYFDANLPEHLFVYTYVPASAIDGGSLKVDMNLGGEEKTVVIR